MLLEDDARVGRMDPFGVGVVRAPATGRDIPFGVVAVLSASMAFARHIFSLHFSRSVGLVWFRYFRYLRAFAGTCGCLRALSGTFGCFVLYSRPRTVSHPKTVMLTCDMTYHNDKHTYTVTCHASVAEREMYGRAGE